MIFDIQIKSAPVKPTFPKNSLYINFIVDSDKIKTDLKVVEQSLQIKLNSLQTKNFLKEKSEEISFYKSDGKPDLVILQKIKLDEKFNSDYFRNYVAGIIKKVKSKNFEVVQIQVPEYSNFSKYFETEEYYYQSMLEGVYLGNYSFDKYKSEKEDPKKLSIRFHTSARSKFRRTIERTNELMSSVDFARDLVNEPAETLTPLELAERTVQRMKSKNVKVTVWKKPELIKKKMNAILAVGRASDNDPCFIILHYKPKKKAKKKIVFVGKGVTYDSGGLSIKPSDAMVQMNVDMAGSATVIGIVEAAARLELPIEIYGCISAVENMISGNSYKPGDLISSHSGKSIEVLNTDAEGRIVLADALDYASKLKPDQIIDFATLTGACVVALGQFASGLFTKDDDLASALVNSGTKTFERIWRLPLWDDYNTLIESKVADVKNIGSRWGGAITAAKFLEHFVDKNILWAHIDMAGTSTSYKLNNYSDDFHPAYGVRLLIDYLSKI